MAYSRYRARKYATASRRLPAWERRAELAAIARFIDEHGVTRRRAAVEPDDDPGQNVDAGARWSAAQWGNGAAGT